MSVTPPHADTRYRVSPEAQFRVLGATVEVTAQGRSGTLPLPLYRVVLFFSEATTVALVNAQLGPSANLDELVTFCGRLEERGILHRPDGDPRHPGLAELARDNLFADEAVSQAIAAQLAAGRAVVIRDALDVAFAERAWYELERTAAWRPYEHVDPNFHYQHHNLFADHEYPPAVAEAKQLFSAARTRALMARLSGRDCAGALTFGASLYLPGDHSLPHRDLAPSRTVAFVWHLTKRWDPSWGGAFNWCPTGTAVQPLFNCLTLFNVAPSSLHFVSAVSPYARGKRLAVNGWWTSAQPTTPAPSPIPPSGISEHRYGAPHETLSSDGKVVAI